MGMNILCTNVNNSNPITHAILNDDESPISFLPNTDLIVITEPWIGTIWLATNKKGTVNHPSWQCHLPSSPIKESRVVVYSCKCTNLKINPMTHTTRGRGDLIILKITLPNGSHFSLIVMYNSPSSYSASGFLTSNTLSTDPTILVGDFNLHSPDWDATVTEENDHSCCFCEWMANNNIVVLNDDDKPTYHGHHFQHTSVIDLALANSHLTLSFDISPVKVLTEDHYGGDHYPISICLQPIQDPDLPNNPEQPYHLPPLHEGKKDDWLKATKLRLSPLTDHLPESPSTHFLDLLAKDIIDAIVKSNRDSMSPPNQNPFHPSKRWWTNDLSSVALEIR